METLVRLISLNAARILFVGGLLLVLYVGLTWALAIEERPDAASVAEAAAARQQAAEQRASEAAAATEEVEAEPTDPGELPPPAEPTISPEEFIAQAKPPAETTVQVLNAGGGNAAVDAVLSVLETFGYDVVAINSSSRSVSATTVYFTDGSESEAEGLRARDPRFQMVEPNRGLSEGVDIHVLVGPSF